MMLFFSPDDRSIISFEDHQLVYRDILTGEIHHSIDLSRYKLKMFNFNFSSDGSILLLMPYGIAPRMIDVRTGKELGRLDHPDEALCKQLGIRKSADEKWVYCGQFSFDGRYVFAGGPYNHLYQWEVETQQFVQHYHHEWGFQALALTQDHRYLVGGGSWAEASIWNVNSGAHLSDIPSKNSPPQIDTITILPDESHALICDGVTGLIVHLESGKVVHELDTRSQNPLLFFAAVASQKNLLITNSDGKSGVVAHIWNARTWQWIKSLQYPVDTSDDVPSYVDITSNGQYAITAPVYGTPYSLWDVESGERIHSKAWRDHSIMGG